MNVENWVFAAQQKEKNDRFCVNVCLLKELKAERCQPERCKARLKDHVPFVAQLPEVDAAFGRCFRIQTLRRGSFGVVYFELERVLCN